MGKEDEKITPIWFCKRHPFLAFFTDVRISQYRHISMLDRLGEEPIRESEFCTCNSDYDVPEKFLG